MTFLASIHARIPPPLFLPSQIRDFTTSCFVLGLHCYRRFQAHVVWKLVWLNMVNSSDARAELDVKSDGPIPAFPVEHIGEPAAFMIDHQAEASLVRKLDMFIIPIVMLLYLFSFLDRQVGDLRTLHYLS